MDVGGVWIEDDFVVTDNGCKIFSSALPKEIEEIEKYMSS